MIVTFFIVVHYILSLFKASFGDEKSDEKSQVEIKDFTFGGVAVYEEGDLRFYPPVYIQRYEAVSKILNYYKLLGSIRKVVDFGCAELSSFRIYKHLEEVEEYLAVDIDRESLQRCYTSTAPLVTDYLHKRCSPFRVLVLRGSVVDPDVRLEDVNVTVAIELIEHMYADELIELPYNIFGRIQPELAIFTTPNSEFNVLFPNLLNGFRHPDHKFEWNRNQFEDWARNISLQYPNYDVSFHGIGVGPDGSQHLGHVTQMAVFLRKSQQKNDKSKEFSELYECIYDVEYPYITAEQKLSDTIDYEVYQALKEFAEGEEYQCYDNVEVPLDVFVRRVNVDCSTDRILEAVKRRHSYVKYLEGDRKLIIPSTLSDDSSVSTIPDDDFKSEDNLSDTEDNANRHVPFEDDWVIDNEDNHINTQERLNDCLSIDENWTMEADDAVIKPDNSFSSSLSSNDTVNKTVLSQHKNQEEVDITQVDVSTSLCTPAEVTDKSFCTNSSENNSEPPNCSQKFSLLSLETKEKTRSCIVADSKPSEKVREKTTIYSPVAISLESGVRTTSLGNILEDQSDLSILSVLPKESTRNASGNDESQCSQNISGESPHVEDVKRSTSQLDHFTSYHASPSYYHLVQPPPSSHSIDCDKVLQRSHSLENVNFVNYRNKKFRYSLNIENDHINCDNSVVEKELQVYHKVSSIPSLSDTFGSHSKAPDSGYPNSIYDMEMDLTPEQVDEIITESESSLEDEESSGEEEQQLIGNNAPVVFLDNVENGDVANNNRDGEGNNMEGGEVVIEEAMGFDEGLALDEGDVEGAQNESDDEGLYMSALDMSNETIVPEESLSQDPLAFNSVYDLPSSSSLLRLSELEREPPSPPPLPVEPSIHFPSWLLDILVNDTHPASGDAGMDRTDVEGSSSTLGSTESYLIDSGSESVEVIVPGDTMGGGEPPPI